MNEKPPPKGDTTQKRRQAHRRQKLDEIAQAAGFASWSAYETAVLTDGKLPTQKLTQTKKRYPK